MGITDAVIGSIKEMKSSLKESTSHVDYEYGDCPILAIALHRVSGFPLMGLVEYDEELEDWVLIHAYIKNGNTVIDFTGETTVEDILDKYPNNGEPEEVEFNEEDLLRIGYQGNKCPSIQEAMKMARKILNKN